MLAESKSNTFIVDVVNETLWIIEIRFVDVVLVIVAVLLVLLLGHGGRDNALDVCEGATNVF